MKRSLRFTKVLGVVAIALLAISVLSALVMVLWNNVLTEVVSVRMISFWQAAGILLLSKILFGGFRGGGGWGRRGGPWGKAMREKWQNMSPEERENFKGQWRGRCDRRANDQPASAGTTA